MNTGAPIAAGQRRISIEHAFQLATDHHKAGRLQQAEQLAGQIVGLRSDHAGAWQLLAVIANQAGNHEVALERMARAIKQDPRVSQFYANRAEMNRQAGHLDRAIADAEQAIKLDASSAQAHSNLGVALYDQGELDRAETCQKTALKKLGRFPQALNNLGSIHRDRKDRPRAERYYRQALDIDPAYLEAANNLGAILAELDRPEESIRVLLDVVRAQPAYGEAHSNLGNAFVTLEDYGRAETAYKEALRLRPESPEGIEGLARCAQENRHYDAALKLVEQAIQRHPERAQPWSIRGGIRSDQAFPQAALEAYDQAIALDADLPGPWVGKGHVLLEEGHLDQAEAAFLHAQQMDPESLGIRLALTQCRKTREGDDNLAALQERAGELSQLSQSSAIPLNFALGKCYEDLKQYDRAFGHFMEGCRLKRQRVHYSADNQDALADNIRAIFTPERMASLAGSGDDSEVPIFVVGMPRSGTTLTETIIASHPDVYGAGELPDLLQLAALPAGDGDPGYPINCTNLSPEHLAELGQRYVAQVRQRAPEARHITDKMPANFQAVGLIHLMLPNAKIIHIQRNPVDTCVSAYTKLFNRSQYQSYDMTELGRYYRAYLEIMAHWRAVMPSSSFYELQYEDLVAHQEEQSRKLIEFCGLPWDDACLSPHRTERNVKTASVTQVREPVYTSSVERWRRYENHLGPLLEALGDAVPQPANHHHRNGT